MDSANVTSRGEWQEDSYCLTKSICHKPVNGDLIYTVIIWKVSCSDQTKIFHQQRNMVTASLCWVAFVHPDKMLRVDARMDEVGKKKKTEWGRVSLLSRITVYTYNLNRTESLDPRICLCWNGTKSRLLSSTETLWQDFKIENMWNGYEYFGKIVCQHNSLMFKVKSC